VFDLSLVHPDSPLRSLLLAVGWSYSGTRDFQHNARFMSTINVTEHLTAAFPPVFITAGNADPLLPQSRTMAAALETAGVATESLFYPADHQPPLPHEYQFDVNLDDGRAARDRLVAFFHRYTDVDGGT
jgi:acetyl esterase